MANGNVSVPPLQKDQKITDWEHFFRAGLASLLVQEGGKKFAISTSPHTYVVGQQNGKWCERSYRKQKH